MRVLVFLNELGIGGTEQAALRWARGLRERGHDITVLTLCDGPRRAEFEAHTINVRIASAAKMSILQQLHELCPDVIHVHAPGHPHRGDVLGEAIALLPKIPVVQTNVFGRFDNPKENVWTDFRLFISWTSCVQATRRSFQSLDEKFFKRNSVAVYPIDPVAPPAASEVEEFRQRCNVTKDEILFGRLSRPEPNKWTDLGIDSFRIAARRDARIKLLLREPPPGVRQALEAAQDRHRFLVLPATSDPAEVARTIAGLDAVLHTSSIGESFGYGMAEPMNYGKPVIANSTPWQDQAQIELVRHEETGFVASTPQTIAEAILKLANDVDLRIKLGRNAQSHIRTLADPEESTRRLEQILISAASGCDNSNAFADVERARATANYLDQHQFGHSLREQLALRPFYYRVRFHEWRQAMRNQSQRRYHASRHD